MYLVKYLAYSEGFKCAEVAVESPDASEWDGTVYAYRHTPCARGFDEGMPESEIVRHLVVLAYVELPGMLGTPDMLRRKLVACVEKSYGFKASGRFLCACRELVDSECIRGGRVREEPNAWRCEGIVWWSGARCGVECSE